MNLGGNLKKLRKEKGLSQEQLAEILNTSRQSISKWESGKAYPDIDNLIQLRSIFKVTLDDLIMDETLVEVKEVENDTKVIEPSGDNYKEDEDDDFSFNLAMGGSIVGIAGGFVTENMNWSILGFFIGMGVGIVIESIRKKL